MVLELRRIEMVEQALQHPLRAAGREVGYEMGYSDHWHSVAGPAGRQRSHTKCHMGMPGEISIEEKVSPSSAMSLLLKRCSIRVKKRS